MFGSTGIGSNEGQVDVRALRAGQFDFRLFSRFFQPLQCLTVFTQVNAVFFPEFFR